MARGNKTLKDSGSRISQYNNTIVQMACGGKVSQKIARAIKINLLHFHFLWVVCCMWYLGYRCSEGIVVANCQIFFSSHSFNGVLIEKIYLNLFTYLFVCFYPDLDECQAFPNSCHLNAECLNTQGSYSCRCRPGYQGDGLNCTCEFSFLFSFYSSSHFDATSTTNQLVFLTYHYFLNLADGSCEGVFCDPNADCRRVLPEGVKQCKCREGWQGDGRNCSGEMIRFV